LREYISDCFVKKNNTSQLVSYSFTGSGEIIISSKLKNDPAGYNWKKVLDKLQGEIIKFNDDKFSKYNDEFKEIKSTLRFIVNFIKIAAKILKNFDECPPNFNLVFESIDTCAKYMESYIIERQSAHTTKDAEDNTHIYLYSLVYANVCLYRSILIVATKLGQFEDLQIVIEELKKDFEDCEDDANTFWNEVAGENEKEFNKSMVYRKINLKFGLQLNRTDVGDMIEKKKIYWTIYMAFCN